MQMKQNKVGQLLHLLISSTNELNDPNPKKKFFALSIFYLKLPLEDLEDIIIIGGILQGQ